MDRCALVSGFENILVYFNKLVVSSGKWSAASNTWHKEHANVGVSERVNFQSSSILNWFIKHRERIKSFSIFASVVYIKRFTTKGKQTLSHFLEKLLITKAIYQLNKYNKAWLNTNLAKTPTLFTVEFQELLEIFWQTYYRFNSREFFTFTCIHTLRLQKRGFLYQTGFLPGFKFSTSHFICVLPWTWTFFC